MFDILPVWGRQLAIKVAWRTNKPNRFKSKLIAEGKLRWLDLGSGGLFEDGFHGLDLVDPSQIENMTPERAKRYFKANILELTDDDLRSIGRFDFIRMQHVFEHFSFEEGIVLLENCAKLLNPDGYLLITVPDLRMHAKVYLANQYPKQLFRNFGVLRIPADSPASCFFSVYAQAFAYSPVENDYAQQLQHKWCYDYQGLEYQVKRVGSFKNIRELKLTDPLANITFTHNRPEEDVALLAQRS